MPQVWSPRPLGLHLRRVGEAQAGHGGSGRRGLGRTGPVDGLPGLSPLAASLPAAVALLFVAMNLGGIYLS